LAYITFYQVFFFVSPVHKPECAHLISNYGTIAWIQLAIPHTRYVVSSSIGTSLITSTVPGIPTVELALTIAALPITLAIVIIAGISVRTESKIGMSVYAVAVVAGLVSYRLIKRIFISAYFSIYFQVYCECLQI